MDQATDQKTLARVNLNAVFRTLELLPDYDDQTRQLLNGVSEIIQFTTPPSTIRLAIHDGTITFHPGSGPNTMNLVLPSAKAVNKLFDGSGTPIPVKGITKIKFLTGPFTQLTDRLTEYLRPSQANLADPEFSRANSAMTLHVAAYALAEIGNSDKQGKLNAARIPDGDILLAVTDGPQLTVRAQGGHLSVRREPATQWRAKMVFADIDSAGQILRGEMSSYAAIGKGLIELGGLIPMLDELNKLLGLVPKYLS